MALVLCIASLAICIPCACGRGMCTWAWRCESHRLDVCRARGGNLAPCDSIVWRPLSGAGLRHSPLSIIYPNIISRSPQWVADALCSDYNTALSALMRELGTGPPWHRSTNIIFGNRILTRELTLNNGNFSLKCMYVSFPFCALRATVNK